VSEQLRGSRCNHSAALLCQSTHPYVRLRVDIQVEIKHRVLVVTKEVLRSAIPQHVVAIEVVVATVVVIDRPGTLVVADDVVVVDRAQPRPEHLAAISTPVRTRDTSGQVKSSPAGSGVSSASTVSFYGRPETVSASSYYI
jgi:hypothetical protein